MRASMSELDSARSNLAAMKSRLRMPSLNPTLHIGDQVRKSH